MKKYLSVILIVLLAACSSNIPTENKKQGEVNASIPFVPVEDVEPQQYIYKRDFFSGFNAEPSMIEGLVANYKIHNVVIDLENDELETKINHYLEEEVKRISQLDLPSYPGIRKIVGNKELTGEISTYCAQINSVLSCTIDRYLSYDDPINFENSVYINDTFYTTISTIDGHKIDLKEVLNREDAYAYVNQLLVEQLDQSIGWYQDSLESMIGSFVIDENTAFELSAYDNTILINFGTQLQNVDQDPNYYNPFSIMLHTEDVLPIYDITFDESMMESEYTELFVPKMADDREYLEQSEEGIYSKIAISQQLYQDPIIRNKLMNFANEWLNDFKEILPTEVNETLPENLIYCDITMSKQWPTYIIHYDMFLDTSLGTGTYLEYTQHFKEDFSELKLEELFDDPNEIFNNETYQLHSQMPFFSWDLYNNSTLYMRTLQNKQMVYESIPLEQFETFNHQLWAREVIHQ